MSDATIKPFQSTLNLSLCVARHNLGHTGGHYASAVRRTAAVIYKCLERNPPVAYADEVQLSCYVVYEA